MAEALPFRLVAADAVQQVQHRVFLLRRVARRRVDLHLAGRADGLGVVGDHLQLPVRHVLALRVEPGGRIGERGHVVGVQHDRAAASPGRAGGRPTAFANRSGANSCRLRRHVSHSCDVPGDS